MLCTSHAHVPLRMQQSKCKVICRALTALDRKGEIATCRFLPQQMPSSMESVFSIKPLGCKVIMFKGFAHLEVGVCIGTTARFCMPAQAFTLA